MSECRRDLETWHFQVECRLCCVEDSETPQSTCPRMQNICSVPYELRTRPTQTSGLFLAARGATVASACHLYTGMLPLQLLLSEQECPVVTSKGALLWLRTSLCKRYALVPSHSERCRVLLGAAFIKARLRVSDVTQHE